MPVLEVNNLRKTFDAVTAVAGISFSIEPGEVFGLLGPNGAGKTTTIRIISTLTDPDSGDVRVRDVPISRTADYKRRIGLVPQEISLSENLTARENLLFFGRLYDLGGATLRDKVDRALIGVGLSDRADDIVATFSGGMKRRLNITAALLHDPDLVLMDEPTAGVDPQARAYIFEIVERLAASGRAVLYTTHYMEEAQRLCRRTAIIDHGQILAMGTLAELVAGLKARRTLVFESPELTDDLAAAMAAQLRLTIWTRNAESAYFNIGEDRQILLEAARAAESLKLRPTALHIDEPTLETVFLELTGRALRD